MQNHLFVDDMMLYMSHSKEFVKILSEVVNEVSNVAGYKINTQNQSYLYIRDEHPKNETKETIPFTIASKERKYLQRNLTKQVQNLTLKTTKINEGN